MYSSLVVVLAIDSSCPGSTGTAVSEYSLPSPATPFRARSSLVRPSLRASSSLGRKHTRTDALPWLARDGNDASWCLSFVRLRGKRLLAMRSVEGEYVQ